jgi:predicted MFS family arabinose efflux permease
MTVSEKTGAPAVHRGIVFVIAACAGVTVANIYLAFPMITLFAQSFGVPKAEAATIATVSQIGYAIGLFFLIPLGDAVHRKRLLTVLVVGATLGLVAASLAPNIQTLGIATFVLSGLTVAPHVLIPLLISIVPESHRGRALASVNAAMTTGIAASRVGGGLLGGLVGWEWTYIAAALLTAGVGMVTILMLPHEAKRPHISYGALLKSTLRLLKVEPRLRWSIALQVPTFATFNLIWSMMILLLTAPPYSLPVAVAALFGLLGLSGLFTAGPAGWLLDTRGTTSVITAGLVVLVFSTIVLQFSLLGLWIVILGVVLMTFGQQGVGIGNQTRTLTLRADSRSRLNTLYMTSNFVGGAIASGIAVLVYSTFGWPGITATALGTALLAAIVFAIDVLRHRTPVLRR